MATAASFQHASGIESHSVNIHPMDGTANSQGTSSATDSAAISSNDFLTLLVTEMKNQDPTATTDPNEYINQLVNVNSLQQLISINQTLTDSLSTVKPKSEAQKSLVPQAVPAGTGHSSPHSRSGVSPSLVRQNSTVASSNSIPSPSKTTGNLAVPRISASATAVARSLSEKVHSKDDR